MADVDVIADVMFPGRPASPEELRQVAFRGMAEGSVSGDASPTPYYRCRGDACADPDDEDGDSALLPADRLFYLDGHEGDDRPYNHYREGWYCGACMVARLGPDWQRKVPVVVDLQDTLEAWTDHQISEARKDGGEVVRRAMERQISEIAASLR